MTLVRRNAQFAPPFNIRLTGARRAYRARIESICSLSLATESTFEQSSKEQGTSAWRERFPHCRPTKENKMNKDRIEGAVNQAKGATKEAVGNLTGDAKLKAEGQIDKAKGAVQNAVGGMKDAVHDAQKPNS
jgi:uncharacterized protein YjbJ (UPF0337 family)